MRQLVYTMFIRNNRPSFHLPWKENLVNHPKLWKYYETDCIFFCGLYFLAFGLNTEIYFVVLVILHLLLLKLIHPSANIVDRADNNWCYSVFSFSLFFLFFIREFRKKCITFVLFFHPIFWSSYVFVCSLFCSFYSG